MKKNIIAANERLNQWCGTEGIIYYEGIEALGYLFQYPVPKLRELSDVDVCFVMHKDSHSFYSCCVSGRRLYKFDWDDDPALAIFWALCKVIK